MSAKDSSKQAFTFEKSLARLESIVKEMESGSLNLDQMIAHFEEGTTLVKKCGETLNEVEQKIEVLVKQGETLTTKPLEASEDHS